ncbi:MAG: hypothetical protein H0X03_07780 [Nitrosopumilus sp.]|nr:hypothetical protein [Nitrosopumilus sp.]
MNKLTKKKIIMSCIISIAVIILLFTLNSESTGISREKYSKYLQTTTDKSVNLTRSYQDEIGLWVKGDYSNITMAKITETFLPKFIIQLNEFNNTKSPELYDKVKENFVKSFENEIKSYELFKYYLITNNSTENGLSIDYLSKALEYETMARSYYNQVSNTSR